MVLYVAFAYPTGLAPEPQAKWKLSELSTVRSADELPPEALTIAAGLSAAQGIADACSLVCELKWPNDVLLNGAKLAGVLIEVRRRRRAHLAVIGIGINVNASPPDEDVDCPATSLAAAIGGQVERIEVIRAVLRRPDQWVGQILAGRCESLHDQWTARCGMINQRVVVDSDGVRHAGRVLDVSPLEGLALCVDGGAVIHLPAAGATIVNQGGRKAEK